MNLPRAASSAYFALPKFTKGDLEEIMRTMRHQDIRDIASEVALPFFPFPDGMGLEESEQYETPLVSPGNPSP